MKRRHVLSLVPAAALGATPPPAHHRASIDQLLEPIRATHDVPALAAGIITTKGLAASGVCGLRKRGSSTPASPGDLWHLGSMTKAMTATLLATWVSRGKLSWDDPISKFLGPLLGDAIPEFPAITVRQLLSHRSGLAANPPRWNDLPGAGNRPDILRRAARQPLTHAPGSAFLYSNLGYMTAGLVAESLGQKLWESLLGSLVAKPLGMTIGFGGTGTPGLIDQPWPHLADGSPTGSNGPAMDNPPSLGPAGTCHASLANYALFAADQLKGAAGMDDALLPSTLYRDLQIPSADPHYALGWYRHERPWAQGSALAHTGSNTMNSFAAWLAPARGFGVIAACNQGGNHGATACDLACAALIRHHLA
jgi:D-alanyl-D-alanine carboxypeptidase